MKPYLKLNFPGVFFLNIQTTSISHPRPAVKMITQAVWKLLHYSCAFASALFVTVSTLAKHCQAHRAPAQPRPRRHTLLICLLVISYLVEAISIVTQPEVLLCYNPQIVHLLLLAFVWSALGLQRTDGWNTLWGTALVTALFEVPLLIISSSNLRDNFRPIIQIICQGIRGLVLLWLLVNRAQAQVKGSEAMAEEARPFLRGQPEESSREHVNYGTQCSTRRSGSDSETITDYGEDDSGSEDDAEIKRLRAERLEQTGGWWGYLKDFSIFIPYLIPRRDRKVQACIAVSILCLAGNRALNVLIPRQLGIVTDKLLGSEAPYGSLAIWLLLSLLNDEAGLGLIQALVKIPITQFSYRQISNAAFSHVMSLSMDFHSDRDSAEVMKAIEQGGALTNILDTAILIILPTFVDLIIAFALLYWKFNIFAMLVMLVASVAFVTLEVFTSNWNVDNRRQSAKAQREEARVMHQAVQGWQSVAYFNMFNFEKRRFGNAVDSQLDASWIWGKRDSYIQALLEAMVPITFFTLASLVLYEISQGQATAGDFVFLMQYWDYLIYPLKYLSHNYRYLMSDLVDAERLLNLLQAKPTIVDKEGAKTLGQIQGHVSYEEVFFSYDPRKPSIQGLNISARPGETVALVGATGAGKSTIFKLLLRFYDVTSGKITVDGHNIQDVTLSSLRDALGVVPQDPLLFNASIMENLRYARPSATDEQVFEACRSAAIHDKILTFADGYNSRVGEQGVKLSGGEIQRLAIARVFLKNPPILILDEATSAVDTGTESDIQGALDVLKKKRTTFLIAHRLSTVVGADQILVVDDGMIVEKGTHGELLKIGGRYRDLWTRQAGGLNDN